MKTLSIEKFRGLQLQANSFQDGNGNLEVADNVVISRDDIISSRRGFRSEYYMPENISVLTSYRDEEFAIGDKLYRFNTGATGTATCTGGSEVITVSRTAHGLQDSDWISDFLVSDESFASAFPLRFADYCGQVEITVASGTPNIFTLDAAEQATASGSAMASWNEYQAITGASFTTEDYVATLKTGKNLYWTTNEGIHHIENISGPVRKSGIPPALDIDAYLSLTSGGVAPNSQVAYRVVFGRKDANDTLHLGSPSDVVVLANSNREVLSGGLSLATGTNVLTVTDSGNGLANGDLIYLYSVDSNDSPPDGSSVAVTGVTGTSFTFDFDDLGVAPSGVTSIEYSTRKTSTVYSSVPAEVTTDYFYQVYRSESVDATVIPDARYKLLEQKNVTASDVSRGFITYIDELPFEIIQSNAELYTNPTQEGEAQSNQRPPLALDMELFKGYTFFSNCTAYRQLALSLIQTTDLANSNTISIAGETYIFRGNATNAAVGNDITTSSATVAAGVVTVTQVAHGFSNSDVIYHIEGSGITLASNEYTITVLTADTFKYGSGASGTSGTVTYEGRRDSSGKFLVTLTEPSSTAADTIAEGIDFTARSIVKACNRNSSKLYGQYVSGIDESPGRMLFTAQALDESAFYGTASSTTVGACFSPVLPTSGTSVSDSQDVAQNALFCSKYLESEAVPIVNRFPIGSQDAAILRIKALRDSLIVMKEDGIFRLNGDTIANFSATALDTTVFLKATRSAAVLNNSVYALTNQGVVQVTDTSVRIVSRQIEPLLTAVLGNTNLNAYTAGVGYESERLYCLTTIKPNTTPSSGNVTYVYNYLTDCWTTWSGEATLFSGALNIETDKLSIVSASDGKDVLRERKDQTKIDYYAQDSIQQVYLSQSASAYSVLGTTTLCINVNADHGVIVGDVLSVSQCDGTLASAYSGGVSAVNGLRTVISTTDKVVCIEAGETAIGSPVGSLSWNRGIQELSLAAVTASGAKKVELTTTVPHGLSNGDAIRIDSLSAAISGAFAAESDILGFRPVTVTSSTEFYVKADNFATGTATGTVRVRDTRGINTKVTMKASFTPQAGEGLVTDSKRYAITETEKINSTTFVLTLNNSANFTSYDLVKYYAAFKKRVLFAPITMGSGVLKQFAEFQAWFRGEQSCSQVAVNFSTDSRYSDKSVTWSNFVGTPAGFVSFGGWGSQPWGSFPWGGGTAVTLDYATSPSVPLRTWVPQASYLATFIQPELLHIVGGEPFELQSISIIGKPATQKVSK